MNVWWKRAVAPVVTLMGQALERRRFSRPPVLIGGCARSGTTLLASILSAHRNLWVVPRETWTFVEWRNGRGGRRVPARQDRLYREILTRRVPHSARRWCEKSPQNIIQLPNILAFFGDNVRVIHIVRDARDVCLSVHPTRQDRYWVPPWRWVRDVEAGLAYRDHPLVHTLTYEAMVADTQTVIAALLRFLDEPLTEEVVDWHAHARNRYNRALYQNVEPVFASSVGKWRQPQHTARCAEILASPGVRPLLERMGY